MESFFEMIDEEKRALLSCRGETEGIKRGNVIFAAGTDPDRVVILLEGYVSLSRENRLGTSRVTGICSGGDVLNEEIIAGECCFSTARALSDSRLLYIDAEQMISLVQNETDIMTAVFRAMAYKTRRLYHQLGSSSGSYPVKNRIAARILKLGRDFGTDTPWGRQLGFKLSVSLMAEMTGAQRETVSRYLSAFRREGCISENDGLMVITDPGRLSEHAGAR